MNERQQSWLPSISLLVLALSAGIAWRAELEFRSGWASLAWIGYFHWAVPICAFAFLLWVVCVARVRRLFSFASTLLVFAIAAYLAVDFAFHLYFAAGPSGMGTVAFLGGGDFEVGFRRLWILPWAAPLLWALPPLVFCAICCCFGVPITIRAALASAALFVLSWPFSIFVRSFFEQRGSPDAIHALKSGFVVPFLIISLGIPLLRFPALLRHDSPRTNAA